MKFIKSYLIPRIIQYLYMVVIGITLIFLIPRLSPVDPVEQILNTRLRIQSTTPEAILKIREVMEELYGLKGSLWEQYINMWKRLLKGDFGPSIVYYPAPVIVLIRNSLPWTIGLLTLTTLISWFMGLVLGTFLGYSKKSSLSRIWTAVFMAINPVPYYIFALTLLLLFCYVIPIFPLGGGFSVGQRVALTWSFIKDVIKHGTLPALSLIILGLSGWSLGTKILVQNLSEEDYVVYAQMMGLSDQKILYSYVLRNAMLPQITGLGLSLGGIFGGAMMTEILFTYPGIGTLAYNAVRANDYNVMIAISFFSIIAVATALLILDLLYPLIDPRIRYR